MKVQVAQVLKWIGYVDGAVVGGAIAFGKLAPQYQPIVDSITGVAATVTSILGIYAHLMAGSQTVTVADVQARNAALAAKPRSS